MIGFFTYDLLGGRERLMPWRTIIEVAKYIQFKQNSNVAIYSIDSNPTSSVRYFDEIKIVSISKKSLIDKSLFNKNNFSHIFYPVTWRSSYKHIKPLKNISAKKTAYFGGGVYSLPAVIKAAKYIGFKNAIPYIIESLISKKRIITILKKANFTSVVALTEVTFKKIVKHGFKKEQTHLILPGKDFLTFENVINLKTPDGESYKEGEYFVFMGAPAKIRGLSLLLKSFDKACNKNKAMKLICFLRTDPGSDNSYINNILLSLQNKSNVKIVWSEVSKDLLFSFVKSAKAVMLPFLLIPSEIPLTYFEVLSLRTTVITTRNGGTTAFLEKGLFQTNRNKRTFAKTIQYVWENSSEVNFKEQNASELINKVPCWAEVGEKWASLL